jgi:hypothetical protein
MNILISLTALALSPLASASILTFEDLPMPTEQYATIRIAEMPATYSGFTFSNWGYYTVPNGIDFNGFDDGIIGTRALYTPINNDNDGEGGNRFTIFRSNRFIFGSASVTQLFAADNGGEDDFGGDITRLTIKGFVGDHQVYTVNQYLAYAVRMTVSAPAVQVDRLEFSTDTGMAFAVDNLTADPIVPAPSALALIGLAGLIGKRKRN